MKETDDTVAPLANAHTLIKQVINLVMILINCAYILLSNSAHLTWDRLAVDPKNPTFPWGEEIDWTWLLGIIGVVYLECKECVLRIVVVAL
jgi:hypothetical protein